MGASPICFAALTLPTLGGMLLGGVLFPPFGLGMLFPLTMLVGMGTLLYMSYNVHLSFCRNVLLGQRLSDMALRDPLTGLRNRRYLHEFMQEETPRVLRRWLEADAQVRNRRSISLILLDLDFFKQVNDQFGHAAGDAVLLQVAQLLREVVRRPDLVLRWGGEEFLILALDSDRTAPPLIAVRVHERFAQHTFILPGGQTYRLTCSLGFAIYPFHPDRPDGLLWEQVFRLADESLYIAKEKGRNRLHGMLPGDGDPDEVIAALNQADPAFEQAEKAGLIRIL
jgi:diguanylate cyclase (GGDEF)-like protein